VRNEAILKKLNDVQLSTKAMADFRIGMAIDSGLFANAAWGDAPSLHQSHKGLSQLQG
jgi:hypothetical protein